MKYTIGILHSVRDFLKFVLKYQDSAGFSENLFFKMFKNKYYVANSEKVIELSQRMEWITPNYYQSLNNRELKIRLTDTGEQIAKEEIEYKNLRLQLKYIIQKERPSWLKMAPQGRRELLHYIKDNFIYQNLNEARLLKGNSREVRVWWDDINNFSRGLKTDRNLEIGREGERKTILIERKRTEKEPIWEALESNNSGFDVRSIEKKNSKKDLLIEVKASEKDLDYADIFITKNEWDKAHSSKVKFLFHVWVSLGKKNETLYLFSTKEIIRHIPQDTGKGNWQAVKIPVKELVDDE